MPIVCPPPARHYLLWEYIFCCRCRYQGYHPSTHPYLCFTSSHPTEFIACGFKFSETSISDSGGALQLQRNCSLAVPPFQIAVVSLPLSSQCAATLTINMTCKHIVMPLFFSLEGFWNRRHFSAGVWKSTSQPGAFFPTLPIEAERDEKNGESEGGRERDSGKTQLPETTHRRHLPVVCFEPPCYWGRQVFWTGDTDGWLKFLCSGRIQ